MPRNVASKLATYIATSERFVFDPPMPTKLSTSTVRRLEAVARRASRKAYAPYSKFRVGAAVLTGSGKIVPGCNVENASYGLCNCAERTAIFTAVAAAETKVRAVVVHTPTKTATAPCGACRQVINEFGPDAVVICICDSDERIESSIGELLPHAFGPRNLAEK